MKGRWSQVTVKDATYSITKRKPEKLGLARI